MSGKRSIPRVCCICGGDFFAYPSEIDGGRRLFCSNACRAREHAQPIIMSGDGLTARIPLVARNGTVRAYAVIDAADAAWASQWRWNLSDGYAARGDQDGGRRTQTIRLHRALLGLVRGDGLDGDHIDRDKLNCRRSNLRILPKGKNPQNQESVAGSSSQYRGVSWNKNERKWVASVHSGGKRIHFGFFVDEHEAGRAARAGRAQLMPYAVD